MVPFSFENIARSASYDPPNAFSVSAAARATHDSFESHLQRAATATVGQPTRPPSRKDEPRERSESSSDEPPQTEPSHNEPVRQGSDNAGREDGEVPTADAAEATAAAETPAQRNEEAVEGVEGDAALADESATVTAANERLVAIQDVAPKPPDDAGEGSDRAVAAKVGIRPEGDEESGLEAPLATKTAGAAVDEIAKPQDEAPAGREVKPAGGERVEPAHAETPAPRGRPSEAKAEVASGDLSDAREATVSDDEPAQASNRQPRHTHRGDISQNRPLSEATNAVPKSPAFNVAATAADTTGEESSRQSQHHRATDGSQPAADTTAPDAAATTSGTPSRFAQHLLARTEDPNARGPSITNADQARFIDRIARAVQATGERGGTLRLRLSPPELGSLTLEVKVQGGAVSARVEADTPDTRSLLLDNLPTLRERLAEHGMRVDQFDVDLADRHPAGTPDGLPQHEQQHEDRPRSKAAPQELETPPANSSGTLNKNGNEQLNIIV